MDRPSSGSRCQLLPAGCSRVEPDQRAHGLHKLVPGRIPNCRLASLRLDRLSQLRSLAPTAAKSLCCAIGGSAGVDRYGPLPLRSWCNSKPTERNGVAKYRKRDMLRPWWRPVTRFVAVSVLIALANTFIPELGRGRGGSSWSFAPPAILAVAIVAAVAVINAVFVASHRT